jgi:hypothetical protein
MATRKVTFTLDDSTIARLQGAAARLDKPKSEVVREASHDFHDRLGRLSEEERLRMLRVLDELVPRIPKRSARAVKRELADIRRARRRGGRKSGAGPR